MRCLLGSWRCSFLVLLVGLAWGVPLVEAACTRRASVVRAFNRQTGYPAGRPGYVVDHIVPLACGGPDTVANMQWQLRADAKAKDKWERKGCLGCRGPARRRR